MISLHTPNLAKYCYFNKQHFASEPVETAVMARMPINDVLAENLAHFMEEKGLNQTTLGAKAGIGQTTVGVYLNPSRRKAGATGKAPSAKLSEVEQLATALEVEVWELLRPLTPAARLAYSKIEAAFLALSGAASVELDHELSHPDRLIPARPAVAARR